MHPFGSDIDTAQDLFRSKALADQDVKNRGKLRRFMHLLVDAHVNRSSIGDRPMVRPSAVVARDRAFSDLELRKHPCGVWALPIPLQWNRTATRGPDRRIDGFSKLPKRVQFCIGLVAKQHNLPSSTGGDRALGGGDRALGRFWPNDARL